MRIFCIILFFNLITSIAALAEERELTAEAVDVWAEGILGNAVKEQRLLGAVVSVVRDGEILYQRGFGRAHVSTEGAVDPQTTGFRIGSITKTFTAMIISQLVEEGKIKSLHDPVNKYLKRIQLPDNDGTEITLHHLLTHSAGFEDKSYAIAADEPITIPVTSAQLEKVRPEYVRPAGNHVVYSNFGVALLGIIIEDIDGDAIDIAMKKRIFDPLGMKHTVLPNSIYAPEHTGVSAFIDGNGRMTPVPYWAISPAIAPAGAIVSTAEDMAKYMMENLSKGALNNAILSSEGFDRLHNRRLGNAEDIGGIAMIFFDGEWNGMGLTSHGGNWTGFHSWMSLIPEKNIGVFVSLMAQPLPKSFWQQFKGIFKKTKDKVTPYLWAGGLNSNFLEHFFGPRKIQLEEGKDYLEPDLGRLSKYNGSYRADRRPYTNMEQVGELFRFGAGMREILATRDGLMINGLGPLKEIKPGVFEVPGKNAGILVIKESPSTGEMMIAPDIGYYTLTRVGLLSNPKIHSFVMLGLFAVGLLGFFALIGRKKSESQKAHWLNFAIACLVLLFPLMFVIGYPDGQNALVVLSMGYIGRLLFMVADVNILLIISLWACWYIISVWRAHNTALFSRILMTVVPLSGVLMSLIFAKYHMIGLFLP